MLQRAWFAPRAQEHSWGGSLELKGSREEAGAWVAGGALPSSPLHARRSDSLDVQRVPQHLFAQFSAARARRLHGSAPRGSAQRSSQAWKRRVQRAPSALVHAGFQASPTRVKLKCPACAAAISRLSAFRVFPDNCSQLRKLERKGQSLDGARRKLQAGGSGPSQRQVRACSLPRKDFPAVSMRVRALRFLKIRPEASCHGVHARSPTCVHDQFTPVRGGLRQFRSPDFRLAHDSCGI